MFESVTRNAPRTTPHAAIPAGGGAWFVLALIASLLLSVGAFAQDASDAPEGDIEEIVVTGSRIQKTNLVVSSPVTQIDAEELEFQGTVRVEDMLRTIPQVWSDQNTGQSNGATGTATVNLRNLGEPRTLVLLNGRRMPAGSTIQGGDSPDINQIPGALVERVEILTGGASAVYGSDAVTGVVNFLLDDDFEGIKLDYQYSKYQHRNDSSRWRGIVSDAGFDVPTGSASDGNISSLSLTMGGNIDGGRGNIVAYATWRKIDPVLQAARDYSACSLNNPATACSGSSTIPEGAVRGFGGLQSYINNVALLTNPATGMPYEPVLLNPMRNPAFDEATMMDDQGRPIDAMGELISEMINTPVDLRVMGTEFVPRDDREYNFGPLNYFQRPDERWTFGSFAHYEVNDHVTAYAEFMFADDRTVAQIAPSGNFYRTDTLNCDNALLSEQQRQLICQDYLDNTEYIAQLEALENAVNMDMRDPADPSVEMAPGFDNSAFENLHADPTATLPAGFEIHPLLAPDGTVRQAVGIGRRNVEGGNRREDLRHTSFRLVTGLRGDIDDNWSYDVFYQYAEVSVESVYMNDLSTINLTRALDVVDDGNGNPVCRTALPGGADQNCVPWNVFTTDAASDEAVNYVVGQYFIRGSTDQRVISAYLTGDLSDYGVISPLAETGVSVAFGVEHREENLRHDPDTGSRAGDRAGGGGAVPVVGGGYDVIEYFVEASIPIMEGQPYAEEWTFDASYRRSDYSYDVETNTYGFRTGWAITPDVKLRASIQRAIRGPSVRELFRPQGLNLTDLEADPCGGPVTNGMTAEERTLEECMRSGVTAAQFGNIPNNPAGQYNFVEGGNLNLKPEQSDSYSFGVVFTPQSFDILHGLILSLDYFEIEIEDGIDNLTPEFVLNECLDGNLSQCALVNRGSAGDLWVGSDFVPDAVSGNSGHILTLLDNLALEVVEGIDITGEYSIEIGQWGDLHFNNVMSIITTWDTQELAGAPVVDCKGNWGNVCGYPTPDFQNNLRVTWTTPWNVRASLLWRHISEVEDLSSSQVDLDETNYLDLSAVWDAQENVSFRFGVNNVLDKEPPVAGNNAGPSINGNGNIFPGIYDALGRYLFVAVSLSY